MAAVAVSAVAISSTLRPISLESSPTVGSLPNSAVMRLRVILMAADRSFSPLLTFTEPSSRKNRRISPAILGTA